jgi:hypothetical protein
MSINDKFDLEILDQIKEKHLKPKAKWIFILKDVSIWSLGAASLLLGAVAFSVIIFIIRNNDWNLYREFSGSMGEFVLLTMPYFWIVFLIIFVAVVNYDLKHTKKGYKYSVPLILFMSIFGSMFLGAIFYGAGFGKALDDVLGERVVFYDRLINPMLRMWDDPEKGHLAGLIVAEIKSQQYRLIDISRNEWLIDISEAEIPNNFMVEVGRPIKLLGKTNGDYYFIVKRVFSHDGPGRGMIMRHLKDGMPPPPEFMMPMMEACESHGIASGSDEGICPLQKMPEFIPR